MPEAREVKGDQRFEVKKSGCRGGLINCPPQECLLEDLPVRVVFRACADSQRLKESEECLVLLCLCESVLVAWLRCMLHQCILRSICGPNVFLVCCGLPRRPGRPGVGPSFVGPLSTRRLHMEDLWQSVALGLPAKGNSIRHQAV